MQTFQKEAKCLFTLSKIIDDYVNNIPFGKSTELATMRNDLAIEYQADETCHVTTGIFLRIVSEASFEELNAGKDIEKVTPFWRIVNPKSKLAEKLDCGTKFILKLRKLKELKYNYILPFVTLISNYILNSKINSIL